ncbi:MAG: site-specific DNA-methyltransferase [Campylobacter sp.]|nr:site-specific DNA-methyltransferase [Campylobacter sp.]
MIEKIIKGDCIKELKNLQDESVDLIFADPPYNMQVDGVLNRPEGGEFSGCDDVWDKFHSLDEYRDFTKSWLSECKRVLKKDGSIWVIGSMQCIYTIGALMQEMGFWLINDVIWHKSNPTPNFMGTRLNNSHETLIWATKNKNSKFTFNYKTAKELNDENIVPNLFAKGTRKQLGSIWKFPVCSGNERLKDENGKKLHSTQKPEILLYRIIAISSKLGDLVLDPFGGTMTTAAMAKKLGRNFIMIEKDENYIKFGKIRLENTKFIDDDITNAVFDIKPKRVSLKEMIEAKFLLDGEKFFIKNSEISATLLSDGKLGFMGEIYDIHTLATKLKNRKSKINGFLWWEVIRDNKKVGIDEIRENFRQFLG